MDRRKFVKNSIVTGVGLAAGTTVLGQVPNQTVTAKSKVKVPKALLKGDLIAVAAPAGTIWNHWHIGKITSILEDLGFRVRIGECNTKNSAYLAGTDKERAEEFMNFIKDPEVKGILTMRGGWGCARILDLLDYEVIRENPKAILGFSDITSLINAIYKRARVITYHGPCGYSSWDSFTKDHVTKSLVVGEPFTMVNPSDSILELKTLTSGKATGELIGGNLTVIVSMIGTPYEPEWDNKILFLEETGEEPYRVDRMLWQMKQADIFDKVSGVVLGSFNKCDPEEPEKSFSLNEVFEQHFSNRNFPAYQGASFGHLKDKFTLPIGVASEMDADNFMIRTLERSVLQ